MNKNEKDEQRNAAMEKAIIKYHDKMLSGYIWGERYVGYNKEFEEYRLRHIYEIEHERLLRRLEIIMKAEHARN